MTFVKDSATTFLLMNCYSRATLSRSIPHLSGYTPSLESSTYRADEARRVHYQYWSGSLLIRGPCLSIGKRQIGGAALDVLEERKESSTPTAETNPSKANAGAATKTANVLISPHIAYYTDHA